MQNPFPLIIYFASGILAHLFTLLAGCVATVIIAFIEKRILKRPISFKLEIGVLSCFLLFACFQTWRDQYTSAEWRGQRITVLEQELVRKAPDFTGEIGSELTATWRKQTVVIVGITLQNRGATDSGVHAWKMSVELDDGARIPGEAPIPPGQDLKIPLPGSPGGLLYKWDGYLPMTTMQPVRAGGSVSGWFWSVFPTTKQEYLFSHKGVVKIEFTEVVSGRTHELSRPLESGIRAPGWEVNNLQSTH